MEPEGPKPDPLKPTPQTSRQTPGLSRPDAGGASGPSQWDRVGGPGDAGDAGSPPPPPQERESMAPPRPEPPPKSGGSFKAVMAAVILALVLAIGYWMSAGGGGSSSPGNPSPATQAMLADETSSPAYQKHKMANPNTPMQLSAADLDAGATQAAIDAAKAGKPIPGLSSSTPELNQQIERGEVKFYHVRAYDTCVEDGDWVTLKMGNGASIGSFMLTKAGTTISIPVVGGQLPNMQLIGDKDGVGGITVGIETSGGTWYSGILAPGQMQEIHLTMN